MKLLTDIELRQIKFLSNIVEQEHRRVRQRIRAMLGFKNFMSAAMIISGIEMMTMIKKRQFDVKGSTSIEQFCALAEKLRPGSKPFER